MTQLPGLPGFENMSGYKILEKALTGMGNENENSEMASTSTSNPDYLQVYKAVVSRDLRQVQAVLTAHGHIPTDGSGGIFGYEILTNQG